MPVVSVVIPAFNPGPYLRATLDSVVAQTYEDWEATVVDDGSTEDLSWVASVDPRVHLITQINQGLSAARNRAIRETSGEFVAFLDADDLWRPGKLAKQVAAMRSTGAALSSTAFDIVDAGGQRTSDGFEGYAESYDELLEGNGVCVSTVLVTRAVLNELGMFDLTLQQVQDWDLWLRIAKRHPVIKLSQVLGDYRMHGNNMSKNYRGLRDESVRVLRRHDHPAAKVGRRRIGQLTGTQAFDEFRTLVRRAPLSSIRPLAYAAMFAPAYTARALTRRSN